MSSRFKIQEWFIAILTEIYMAYIPRLKPRWAYLSFCCEPMKTMNANEHLWDKFIWAKLVYDVLFF